MHIEKKTLRNIFIGVVFCIILYWILNETDRVKMFYNLAKGVIAPFLLGSALAFILNVPMRAFENLLKGVKKLRLRRFLALGLTFLSVLLVLSFVFWLLIPQIIDTVSSLVPKLRTFISDSENVITGFLEKNPQVMGWLIDNTDFENLNWAAFAEKAISMVGTSFTAILGGTFLAIGSISSAMMDLFIAIVFSIYCLFQKETLARQGRRILYAFLPEKWGDEVVRILRLANSTFSNFLSGQCVEVCILGSMFAICMAIFRMPYIPLISVVIAVTAFIPTEMRFGKRM